MNNNGIEMNCTTILEKLKDIELTVMYVYCSSGGSRRLAEQASMNEHNDDVVST